MSDDAADPLEGETRKPYGLVGRIILFLFIAGPGSVLGFGLWVRIGMRGSAASGGNGQIFSSLVFWMWVFGLVSTAFMVFKR